VVAVVIGCAPSDRSASAAHDEALADTLLSLAEDYNAAWEQWRAEPILRLHSKDFQYYWYDQRLAQDFEEILREEWLPRSKEYSIQMIDPHVEPLGRNAGVVSFQFHDREVSTAGAVQEHGGALTYIFERRGSDWKLIRVHQSGPVPEEYR